VIRNLCRGRQFYQEASLGLKPRLRDESNVAEVEGMNM
jgi:hypothetical protein